jgi:holo-[acyl-carrier protein] synthase
MRISYLNLKKIQQMITGIGTDIIEIPRIAKSLEKYGERFAKRVFTPTEIEYCESYKLNKDLHYAVRFAAKESFSKAVGTGLTDGFKLTEIGIRNDANGKPVVELSGGMLERYGNLKIHVSLSHTDTNAIAYVVLEEV